MSRSLVWTEAPPGSGLPEPTVRTPRSTAPDLPQKPPRVFPRETTALAEPWVGVREGQGEAEGRVHSK